MPLINPILKASIVKIGEKEVQFIFSLLKVLFPSPRAPRAFSRFQPSSHSISQCSSKRATGHAPGHLVEQRGVNWGVHNCRAATFTFTAD